MLDQIKVVVDHRKFTKKSKQFEFIRYTLSSSRTLQKFNHGPEHFPNTISWGVWAPRMSVLPQDSGVVCTINLGYQSWPPLGYQSSLCNITLGGDPLLPGNLVSNHL